ncbi:DHH family phosphoesterase [Bombilactobacillus thymidiniphilus]|uniref:Cyclic-di-AMP phosphodiesterase n=1 Tax=Bombilactobacillus thymidiniphilus TaxID=2923363 RepID=A0ABY4PB23_9LACO|nr:DHH family phosphoesterase [Bombilactobacillus thymidiniphilus]UQS82955.1 DHH family phosphoesterase [Bombilactobacillus thymidiniphilus]
MENNKIAKRHLLAVNRPLKFGFVIVGILTVLLVVLAYMLQPLMAVCVAIVICLIAILGAYSLNNFVKQTNKYLYDLSFRKNRGEQEAMIDIPIGMLLYDNDKQHTIEWVNPNLQYYFGKRDLIGHSLSTISGQLDKLVNQDTKDVKAKQILKIGDSQFQVYIQSTLQVIYLSDVTEHMRIEQQYADEKIAVGQVFLDNYDELTQTMADRDLSNLNSYVTNQLTDWAGQNSMFLKRVSSDRFIIIAYAYSLRAVEQDGFQILDKIRRETSQQNYPLTVSIGFSYGSNDLNELAQDAQKNLDLALGRGGDQAVVRQGDEQARFYGGNTNPMEKRTRVRARMISQALRDLFNHVDTIYVMGHAKPDMDSIGACLGIHRIAQLNNKVCKIVVDGTNAHTDVLRLLDWIHEDPNLKKDIVKPNWAVENADQRSMLIMVDVSKPSMTMSPELYDKLATKTVVIDHHRRGEEFPKNPVLAYIEPYASSACELVTEMIEYQPQTTNSLSKLEATAMLAGMAVDTHSFTLRTGTRTFDAASYLRSVGADGTQMQNLLKENIDSYIERNHLIDSVDIISPGIALCAGEEDQNYDAVIAAQAADTLLMLAGIEASFVITKQATGKVAISARSLGNLNVQVIMEKMGGGGHLSNAATQLSDVTIAQAKKELIEIVQEKVEDRKKENDEA